jgi:hypothetical protein
MVNGGVDVMLPASKGEFPKCLYLDQNKWIDLAKAHYGKPDGEPFQECLEAVRAGVKAGKLVLPFSVVNAIEGMLPRDAGRRARLARFIVELSGNRTIAPEDLVCRLEIANAITRLYGRETVREVRGVVVQTGVGHLMGMDIRVPGAPAVQHQLDAFLKSEELSVNFLVGSGEKRDLIDRSRSGEAHAVGIFEQDRAALSGMSLGARRKMELNSLLINPKTIGTYRGAVDAALQEVGATIEDFRSRVAGEMEAVGFLAGIPNLDVLLTLRTLRDQDKVRPIAHNDMRDLDWLSVALPYSNVVVSENYWGHQVQAAGLDAKYRTTLLTDLRLLPAELTRLNCIES